MKSAVISLLSFAALAVGAHAQTTVYLSNLSNPTGSTISISQGQWLGQHFQTDSTLPAYHLDSATLNLGPAGNTSGNFFVSIYTQSGNAPGTLLGTLTGTSNPSVAGNYTFAASGITLTAATDYWIVAGVSSGSGSYSWIDNATLTHTGSWTLFNFPSDGSSANSGANWSTYTGSPYMFSLSASAVPEPSTYALLAGAAALALVVVRRRRSAC